MFVCLSVFEQVQLLPQTDPRDAMIHARRVLDGIRHPECDQLETVVGRAMLTTRVTVDVP